MASTNNSSSLPTDDYANPYFLHPSDNPGAFIVSQPLNGDNYNSWSRAILMALGEKNKIGFVDGTIPKPLPTDKSYHSWQRNNNIVASWLLNFISKDLQASVIYSSSATAIWNDLRIRFQQHNGPRVFQLRRDLVTLKQGSLNITHYFTKIKALWEELAEYQPSHACTCGGIKPWIDHHQSEYAMLFLMGLNEGYSHIRGQILLMDPIPPIEKGFSLVLQEEKQQELGIPTNSNDTPTAFAYKSGNDAKSRTNNPTKERPKCEHCGKLGHIKDKCFKLHGYPTHLKQGNSNTNVNQVSDKSAKAFQFTTDQYHQILSLLQNQPSSNCIESNPIVNGHSPQQDDWHG
ncbi:uncharacterized protein LOC109804079 [Cajanus cajan]|uniref:uncharacterized protein LOC109804079 n=1 Tax=Cajanus cajan TaxID=3821 RepID=UPI00098D85E9|nr:uncharacterized protein LOC109804079 [Cajanus cajan]